VAVLAFLLLALSGGADLDDLARRCDFSWTHDPATGRHRVRAQKLQVAFVPGFDSALVDGVPRKLSAPVAVEGGRVKLPPELAALIEKAATAPLLAPAPRPAPVAKPDPKPKLPPIRIVIDPGHGGIHTGYRGRNGLVWEKDVNLAVSLELRDVLVAWGAEVVLTREVDTQLSTDIDDDLAERVRIANAAKADLFLSVHANGVANPGPRGYEVWVPVVRDARGQSSRSLADLILAELGGVFASDNRGIKDDHNLRVLKGTKCPAALVELEFVSNPAAERELARPATQRRLAEALARAVRDYVAKAR
jgi:N-acetylmuramoyl-L-alanine amidase